MPKKSLKKPPINSPIKSQSELGEPPKTIDPKKILAGATLTGSLLLTPGSQKLKALPDKPPELRLPYGLVSTRELKKLLAQLLGKILPQSSRVLTAKEETLLTQAILKTLGIKAVAELDGNRLNHQLGLMGLEQHLQRYPGDISLAGRPFPQAGVAPGKGAWGYWASSPTQLTQANIDQEKYYIAAQTLYLPDWHTRTAELSRWYKYRKVLVINPDTGDAVVAVVADAGPAQWTGKQFGGSPQLMHDLEFYPQRTKGKVIVLFVDDPEDKVPLGPVKQPVTQPELETA